MTTVSGATRVTYNSGGVAPGLFKRTTRWIVCSV
jgi:hypothetical protein